MTFTRLAPQFICVDGWTAQNECFIGARYGDTDTDALPQQQLPFYAHNWISDTKTLIRSHSHRKRLMEKLLQIQTLNMFMQLSHAIANSPFVYMAFYCSERKKNISCIFICQ